jgi:hypothetical protein
MSNQTNQTNLKLFDFVNTTSFFCALNNNIAPVETEQINLNNSSELLEQFIITDPLYSQIHHDVYNEIPLNKYLPDIPYNNPSIKRIVKYRIILLFFFKQIMRLHNMFNTFPALYQKLIDELNNNTNMTPTKKIELEQRKFYLQLHSEVLLNNITDYENALKYHYWIYSSMLFNLKNIINNEDIYLDYVSINKPCHVYIMKQLMTMPFYSDNFKFAEHPRSKEINEVDNLRNYYKKNIKQTT